MAKAFIDRGHEPVCDGYGVDRLTDFRQLPALLGLEGLPHTGATERVA